MRRRFLVLTLTLAAALACAGEVQPHRLKAACQLLPGKMVRVETWFDNGEKPTKGHVQVCGADGNVLREGQLDRDGTFQFEEPADPAAQVVVDAGEGHRAQAAIHPGASSNHASTFPIKDVLTGLLLVLGIAALALSVRNARALRRFHTPK